MTDLNPNQQLKKIANESFNEHVAIIVKSMERIPMHPQLRSYANMNFDQFAYWVRQGIAMMPETMPEPAAPVDENPPVPDANEQTPIV